MEEREFDTDEENIIQIKARWKGTLMETKQYGLGGTCTGLFDYGKGNGVTAADTMTKFFNLIVRNILQNTKTTFSFITMCV